MGKINTERVTKDLEVISKMLEDYSDEIWCRQEGNPTDFDHQPKYVKIAMVDARTGLFLAREALKQMLNYGIKE